MRRNPLPVVVPCHRVTASGGGLGGYGGESGPEATNVRIKRFLLDLEGPVSEVTSLIRESPAARAPHHEPETHRT